MKKMQIPIVMAAFGTTSQAEATYKLIDARAREAFPGHEIYWSYSSRTIKGLMRSKKDIRHPHEVLHQLHAQGHGWAVVQSVHLTCGHEFYRLLDEIEDLDIRTSVGMPLLTSPQDYLRAGECLKPLIQAHKDKAILLMGHGTDHPCWTAYPAFQQVLRRMFGGRVFVGALEQFPFSGDLIAQIAGAGYKEVLLIPFLLVAGMHYHNDLMGDDPGSWRSRLLTAGVITEVITDGIGCLPCIGEIFCNHIREALDVIPA
jgi:sirohydrochlorin cobaltochelatase